MFLAGNKVVEGGRSLIELIGEKVIWYPIGVFIQKKNYNLTFLGVHFQMKIVFP